jgi:hypothetical protein
MVEVAIRDILHYVLLMQSIKLYLVLILVSNPTPSNADATLKIDHLLFEKRNLLRLIP